MPQPTGQFESTSTIANPSPWSCASQALRIIDFVFPMDDASAMEPRLAKATPGSTASISVMGTG